MKNTAHLLPLVALLVPTVFAWAPSCGYNDCMQAWDGSSCTASSGWDCICSNATALAQINTCVATSCTNVTDQEAIYGAIAQNCANNGVKVTNSQQATFSATSGGSVAPAVTGPGGWGPNGGWNSGSWSSWVSACGTAAGSAPSGWNGNGPWGGGWRGGPGGWGGNGNSGAGSPWGTKASGVNCAAWTTWTAGWGPASSWTGTWSGCSTKTASPVPATITTTVTTGGTTRILTGTTFGIQAAAATTTGGVTVGTNAASSDMIGLHVYGAAAAAVFAAMIAL